MIEMLETIISNQEKLATKVVVLEKGMQEIHSRLTTMDGNISRSHSVMSTASRISLASEIEFKMITNEDDLIQFEKSIADDADIRKKWLNYFSDIIGVSRDSTQRTIAL